MSSRLSVAIILSLSFSLLYAMEDPSPTVLLYEGIQKGNIEIVQKALKLGAPINEFIDDERIEDAIDLCATPLLHAVMEKNKNKAIIQLLINYGADLNKTDEEWGITPLATAIRDGDLEIANLLLNAGADINLTPRRQSPLYTAISMQDPNVPFIIQLLHKGADCTDVSPSRLDPFLAAALNASKETRSNDYRIIVHALLFAKAPIKSILEKQLLPHMRNIIELISAIESNTLENPLKQIYTRKSVPQHKEMVEHYKSAHRLIQKEFIAQQIWKRKIIFAAAQAKAVEASKEEKCTDNDALLLYWLQLPQDMVKRIIFFMPTDNYEITSFHLSEDQKDSFDVTMKREKSDEERVLERIA